MAVNNTAGLQNQAYGVGKGIFQVFPAPIVSPRAPTTSDKAQIGRMWINTVTNLAYVLTNVASNIATWVQMSGVGVFSSLTVTPGPISLTGLFTLTAGTNNASFAADAADHSVAIGSSTGVSAFTIRGGSGASTITTAGGSLTVNAGVGTIGISTDASISALNLGTGAAVKTIAVGGTSANVITIGNTQTAGSVAIGTAMTTGTISIGGTGLQTGTVSIAPGTGAQTVNIGTGATGAKAIHIGDGASANVITIGSVTGVASTTIKAGSGGIFLETAVATPGLISMLPATDTQASPSAASTLNAYVGAVKFTGFTTAAAGTQAFTITDSIVGADSAMLVTVSNASAGNDCQMTLISVVKAAGSFVVNTKNNGAQALDSDVVITFWCLA